MFILGGTGFIGANATHALVQNGHQVRTLALPPVPPEALIPGDVEIILGDFNHLEDEMILGLLAGCQGVVFAGGGR